MDEQLILNWNALVRPEDHVYHLGDVTLNRSGQQRQPFIDLCHRLHGHKRLVMGNHDHFPVEVYLAAGFEKIYGTWRGIENILLSHIPVHAGSVGSAVANVHGHIHDNPSPAPATWTDSNQQVHVKPYINICVEHTDYFPLTLGQVKERIAAAILAAKETDAPLRPLSDDDRLAVPPQTLPAV